MDDNKLTAIRDLTKFAPLFLKVKLKKGGAGDFTLNRAQTYIHQRLEAQLSERGRVRALILKGRQQGCSTYIQARYFHKIITSKGKKAFILTHEKEATQTLFGMAKRFYDNLEPGLCPRADTSNAKELVFSVFDSGYAVGTAGNKGVGRSQTIQLFHGSEVGFWPNAEEHSKGVLEAVSRSAGTEIILESTANGLGNYFHNMWQAASEGKSDFQAIFVPWYWDSEYAVPLNGMKPNEEEEQLLSFYAHDGLTPEHLAWRRLVISDKSKDYNIGLEFFKQEYPFTAREAFLNPIANVFINSKYVMAARRNVVESEAKLVIGVDVAISDKDRTAIIRRKGRVAFNLEMLSQYNTMEIVGRLRRIIDTEKPSKVFIDCIGIGAGVVDRLQEIGYKQVIGVNVARAANEKDKFKNTRAELWSSTRDWLQQEMPVQIPDDDDLHGELCCLGYKENSQGQLQIESKDDLKARGMPSPDRADALCLTFFDGFYGSEVQYPMPKRTGQEKGMFY